MIAALLLALAFASPQAAPSPAPAPPDLAGAVAAYRDGRYAEAAKLFGELAVAEPDDRRAALLHTNAGTAAARTERWGEAAWQLRRALELSPRDPVAAANLQRLSEQLGSGETEERHFTATFLSLPLRLTPHENAWAAGLAAGLALLLLALWRAGRAGVRTAWCATFLLVAAVSWWPFGRWAWTRERTRAVVIEPVVTGRAEPDTRAEILFRLSQGSVVRHADEQRGWRLIETEGGARGWVPAEEVRPLARRR